MTNPMDAVDAAQKEYDRYARQLAVGLMVQHRLDTDPHAPGDRSARSDAARKRMQAESLEKFTAASAALDAARDAWLAKSV